jgi:predicted KAP-like P-loop ATPase
VLNLQTASILAELSCEVSQMQQIEKYLQDLVSELATFRSAVNAQDVADARSNFTPLETQIRKALSDNLDAMEIACTYGLGVLADEKAYTIGHTSTAANSTQPSRILATDNSTLLSDLDDLDALMDSEIVLGTATRSTTTTTTTASAVPPKHQ